MHNAKRHVLVTAGAGFIGAAVTRHLIRSGWECVVVVDKLTYAGSLDSLSAVSASLNFCFEQCDIADRATLSWLLEIEDIDCVMHLAAETHVDRSIRAPYPFIETNIVGTFSLLETVLGYWRNLDAGARSESRFHLVSTDEVFGEVESDAAEPIDNERYRPSSPYSASKAASDHLARAWHRTYGLPVIISHSSNTYGPYQFPDKLIPLIVTNAIEEQPLPVYGAGKNMRDWIYVDDHARALELVLARGQVGQAYSIAQGVARSNLDVVRMICRLLDRMQPRRSGEQYEQLITFVADRPGHDRRYPVGSGRADVELGWAPTETLKSGLAKTVQWYLEHPEWWRARRDDARLTTKA